MPDDPGVPSPPANGGHPNGFVLANLIESDIGRSIEIIYSSSPRFGWYGTITEYGPISVWVFYPSIQKTFMEWERDVDWLTPSNLVPTGQLGTGTADSTKFLRGDGTWQTVSGGSGLTQPEVMARMDVGF